MPMTQIRGLGAAGPAALAFSASSSPALLRGNKTPTQRERDLELAIMISGGLAATAIGVLYAMDKTRIAGALTMATGLMGTIYGSIRLLGSYDAQVARERADMGLV